MSELKLHQMINPAKLTLSDIMHKRGYNNSRLAKETGIRPTTIANYKANLCDSVKLSHLAAICKALDCGVLDVIELDK